MAHDKYKYFISPLTPHSNPGGDKYDETRFGTTGTTSATQDTTGTETRQTATGPTTGTLRQ